jgi:hypothetical protein
MTKKWTFGAKVHVTCCVIYPFNNVPKHFFVERREIFNWILTFIQKEFIYFAIG